MAEFEWADLPIDMLVLIAKRIEFFEDFFMFYAVCKSWYSVTSILGKYRRLPSRFPWVMLTDKAEVNFPDATEENHPGDMLLDQVRKNEQIEGMHNRPFYCFSASKVYEFELPEATRKKCLGVGYGLLVTGDINDLQINILNPFTRQQQISMPNMLSFSHIHHVGCINPESSVTFHLRKIAMSSNPYNPSNGEDCIIMAIYGTYQLLAFARPGDKVWTDIKRNPRCNCYQDVVFYNGKFYGVLRGGYIDVCDINEAKATHIALAEDDFYQEYLVESSGDLLLVTRIRTGKCYDATEAKPYNYTIGFSISKLEECHGGGGGGGDNNYPYKLTQVKSLGNKALFIGFNSSASVPSSRYVKANSIYFSDHEVECNFMKPSGYDTGIYDVETGNITLHYASNFMSHLTPPMWII